MILNSLQNICEKVTANQWIPQIPAQTLTEICIGVGSLTTDSLFIPRIHYSLLIPPSFSIHFEI